ncbi:LOW QUALITY PROTEIN: hypothetical protein PHMEG_0006745 [Phytophthora megakarya]|uniref:Uncharacterized protein n=1 Tax=Phytophthora megakarya TaxID=4795 RepID=A0A225WQA5_9STRA|nr:LOW QUALITY PROTEIN: hypothetical protein PHMEG_0006745 [Phytophthora megakarya]
MEGLGMTRGLSREQVISRVCRIRRVYFDQSTDMSKFRRCLKLVMDRCIKLVMDKKIHFNLTYAGENRPDRGHPFLIRLLTYVDVSFFVGNFYCVSTSFYQCIILMVYD